MWPVLRCGACWTARMLAHFPLMVRGHERAMRARSSCAAAHHVQAVPRPRKHALWGVRCAPCTQAEGRGQLPRRRGRGRVHHRVRVPPVPGAGPRRAAAPLRRPAVALHAPEVRGGTSTGLPLDNVPSATGLLLLAPLVACAASVPTQCGQHEASARAPLQVSGGQARRAHDLVLSQPHRGAAPWRQGGAAAGRAP